MRFSILFFAFLFFLACSEINSGYPVDGGGYIKYSVNKGLERTIKLSPEDATVPDYGRHYFSITTREERSSIGDIISFLIASPKLGKNQIVENYTWFVHEYALKSSVILDSSEIILDEKNDSIWTGYFKLYFPDCKTGTCDKNKILEVDGRFRYWIDPDD